MFYRRMLLFYLLFTANAAMAQGSWTLDYLPVDSLNESFLGREVRVDFKASARDILKEKAAALRIRNLFSTADTAAHQY